VARASRHRDERLSGDLRVRAATMGLVGLLVAGLVAAAHKVQQHLY
jgi:hypothetical protein